MKFQNDAFYEGNWYDGKRYGKGNINFKMVQSIMEIGQMTNNKVKGQ